MALNMLRLLNGFLARFNPEKYPTTAIQVPNSDCSEFEVNLWELSRFVTTSLVPVVGVSPFPLSEQLLMVGAVCRFRSTHIFEWGTNIGVSARIFHDTCKAFGISTMIHSIDLPDAISHCEHPGSNRGRLVRGLASVQLHTGDGLDTTRKLLRNITDEQPRLLFFVDGDHSYESVLRELLGIHQLAPNAAILVHDTFYQSTASGYNIGPFLAIRAFLAEVHDLYSVMEQKMGLPGMTLLWR